MAEPKRPRDVNQLAHLIGGIATGEIEDTEKKPEKDPAAVALGRKGGNATAEKMTPEERSAAAKKAVEARWKKKRQGPNDPS